LRTFNSGRILLPQAFAFALPTFSRRFCRTKNACAAVRYGILYVLVETTPESEDFYAIYDNRLHLYHIRNA